MTAFSQTGFSPFRLPRHLEDSRAFHLKQLLCWHIIQVCLNLYFYLFIFFLYANCIMPLSPTQTMSLASFGLRDTCWTLRGTTSLIRFFFFRHCVRHLMRRSYGCGRTHQRRVIDCFPTVTGNCLFCKWNYPPKIRIILSKTPVNIIFCISAVIP